MQYRCILLGVSRVFLVVIVAVADYCVFEITFFEVGNNTCTRMQELMSCATVRGLRCTVLPSPFFDSTFPVFAESFAGIGKRR